MSSETDRVSPIEGLRDKQGRFVTDYRTEHNPLLLWLIDSWSRKIASVEALRRDHAAGIISLRPDTVDRMEVALARDMAACQRVIARYTADTEQWWRPDIWSTYGKDMQG